MKIFFKNTYLFCFYVPNVCKAANTEIKMFFFGYFGHDFLFTRPFDGNF